MKRLQDMEGQDQQDPLFQRGRALVQQTPPAAPVPEIKDRVWRSLQHAPGSAPRGLRILMVRLAMVAIVALGAGTAGAVIARRWIAPALDGAAPAAEPIRTPVRHEKARPVVPAEPVVAAAEPVAESPRSKAPARSAPRKPAIAVPSAAAVARERTEVLDALVALRREHDAVRAGALLTRYLTAHPQGALREEALALAMEAADARGDRSGAAQLAQTYENEFPAGRFLIFARSHTEARASH